MTTSTTSPERIEQVHEDVEQVLSGDGGGQDGHLVAALGIAIGVAAITLAGDHVQADRRADRIRQGKTPIASDAKVSVKLVLAEIVETGPRHTARIVAQHTLEEALKKTHRKGSPPKPRRTLGKLRVRPSATASSGLGYHSQATPSQASA